MSFESTVKALLVGADITDPKLAQMLDFLTQDLYKVYNQIYPPSSISAFGTTGQVTSVSAVTGFTATLFSNNLRLTWNALPIIATYEIRYHSGSSTDWDTASALLVTGTNSADINPLTIPLIYGTYTFLLKATATSGIQSAAVSAVVSIPVISGPMITASVIENFVLLSWTVPTSTFAIASYNVYRNGAFFGSNSGTFITIFETVSGTNTYKIEAVDIVGNIGTQSSIDVTVTLPTEFELIDDQTSTFTGTKTNAYLENSALIVCVNTTKTYAHHFSDPGYTSWQDAVDAGYDLFCEPNETTASYEEVIDYGLTITDTVVTLLYNTLAISGSVSVTAKIAYSADNITYSAFATGTQLLIASFRYLKIRFEFVGSTDKSTLKFYELHTTLSVSRGLDSGVVHAVSTDVGGTTVNFNVAFKSIESITLTPNSTTAAFAIYDFTSVPNPTSFKVLAFNAAGTRITVDVSWKARGII
jgi:hypothetical protein